MVWPFIMPTVGLAIEQQADVRIAVQLADAVRLGGVASRRGEVEAGAEEVAATGENDGAHAVVGLGGGECGVEIGEQIFVDGVGLRTVEDEDANAALAIGNTYGAHARHRVTRTSGLSRKQVRGEGGVRCEV